MREYSEEQLNVINSNSKHIAVIAGAGAGKTTVLIQKIKTVIDDEKILVITFTKKAAKEVRNRLKAPNVLVKTFDAFCYSILAEKPQSIYEEDGKFTKKELLSFNLYDINFKKGNKPRGYDNYVKYKTIRNAMDFCDIEYSALKQIKKNKITFDYIFIDEFQDTNYLQYEVFKALISEKTKTLIVGDPDQSIYKFRGAHPKIIQTYVKEYKAQTLFLSNNYRSDHLIIEKANKLIVNNKQRFKKVLKAVSNNKGLVKYLLFNSEELEYNCIISLYNRLQYQYQSFAIIYRNNIQGYYYKNYFRDKVDNVSILTVHEAKGLEFDVVFIVGVNKNVFPSNFENNQLEIEEERRLMFVAVTRARHELYITSSKKKSRFVKEMKLKE